MKRMVALFAALILAMELCACTAIQPEGQGTEASQDSTWQEQYDLGVRCLFEGNYQEAILAFTAAIEIDPKRAPAYVGRGDAYIGLNRTDEDLNMALLNYLKAIELGDTSNNVHDKITDVYLAQENIAAAVAMLFQEYNDSPSDSNKERLFDLFDKCMPNVRIDQYLFTKNVVHPSEWTINGTALWEATVADIGAVLGGNVIPVNRGPYFTGDPRIDEFEEYGGFMLPSGDQLVVDKESQQFLYGDYTSLPTECRDIKPGMTTEDCLASLGVSKIGSVYLLERIFEHQDIATDSGNYFYMYNCYIEEDENQDWGFYALKSYAIDGVQWHLSYNFNDEDTGSSVYFNVIFLCNNEGIVDEIRYRNMVNGTMVG